MSAEVATLLRLMQLASPSFPVGAYSYSQALEWAVHDHVVHDEASARIWIGDQLRLVIGRFEAPLFLRLHAAWAALDGAEVGELDALFIASRETSELRDESVQMGASMRRTLVGADLIDARQRELLNQLEQVSYLAGLACASASLPAHVAISAYLWSWLENQVLNAVKTVPLGQLAGQRLLSTLAAEIPDLVESAQTMAEEDLANFSPALAIASSRHETQYTRLYRS